MGDYGCGTLIAPTWVLTHNHFIPDDIPEPGDRIRFDDRTFVIKNVYRYPERDSDRQSNGSDSPEHVDLTLSAISWPPAE
ncbi:MAG: hypothetical protein HUJ26_07125 [Planctomycetaceae bacterium]|nr:hypothetical protein [Planctomycetaceae bacterium]